MKPLLTLLAATQFALPALAGGLPKGTVVRIEGSGTATCLEQGAD